METLRTIDIEKRYEKHVEAYKTVSTDTFCLLNGYYFITLNISRMLGKAEGINGEWRGGLAKYFLTFLKFLKNVITLPCIKC